MILVWICLFAALGGFLFGYDLGLIGGALLQIERYFSINSSLTLEMVVGSAKLGAAAGTFLGGAAMARYGRQRALALNSIAFALGPLVMAVATAPWMLILGRFIVGLGIGVSATVSPAYIAELAPAAIRGTLVQLYEVMLCIGMLSAPLVDWALSRSDSNNSWRVMVGLPALPGLVLAAAPLVLPESPRWLVMRNRLDEALLVLTNVMRGSGKMARQNRWFWSGGYALVTDKDPSGAAAATATAAATAAEQKVVHDAEDELLQLWSGVEMDRNEVLERRRRLWRRRQQSSGGRSWGRLGVWRGTLGRPKPPSLEPIPEEPSSSALSSPSASGGGRGGRAFGGHGSNGWGGDLWYGGSSGGGGAAAAAGSGKKGWSGSSPLVDGLIGRHTGHLSDPVSRTGLPTSTQPSDAAGVEPGATRGTGGGVPDQSEQPGSGPGCASGFGLGAMPGYRIRVAPQATGSGPGSGSAPPGQGLLSSSSSSSSSSSRGGGGGGGGDGGAGAGCSGCLAPPPEADDGGDTAAGGWGGSPGARRPGSAGSGAARGAAAGGLMRRGGTGGAGGGSGSGSPEAYRPLLGRDPAGRKACVSAGPDSGATGERSSLLGPRATRSDGSAEGAGRASNDAGGGAGFGGRDGERRDSDDGTAEGPGSSTTPRTPVSMCLMPGEEASFLHTLAALLGDIGALAGGSERRALGLALGLAFFDQITASTAIINYAPNLLSHLAGDKLEEGQAMLYTVAIGAAKAVGVVAALLLVDRCGRRPLLVSGSLACAAALAATTWASLYGDPELLVGAMCIFTLFFSVSWAGLYWVVVSELFSMTAKSAATSAATGLLFLTGAFTNLVFLTLRDMLGAYVFLLFAGLCLSSAAYVWVLLPETKGRTLAEVQAMLAADAPAGAGAGAGVGAGAGSGSGVGTWLGRRGWSGWWWNRDAGAGPRGGGWVQLRGREREGGSGADGGPT